LNLNKHYPFELKPLPYDYSALEPYIDEQTLHFHHDKHLKTYIDNLNKILKSYPDYQNLMLIELLINVNSLPEEIQTGIINNGGGVFNHEIYFNSMKKHYKDNKPVGKLAKDIEKYFNSFENFKEKLKEAAVSQFGSGYGWLVADVDNGLKIVKTPNQNTPLTKTAFPFLNVDIWEHAYYLQYQNRRTDYVENWFNVINWEWLNDIYKDIK